MIVRLTFFDICRLRDFGQPLKSQSSITIFAGWMTKGYEKTRLRLKRILTVYVTQLYSGRADVMSGSTILPSPKANTVYRVKPMYRQAIKVTVMNRTVL